MRRAVGVDLGGTKIAAAVVSEDGSIAGREEFPSDLDDAASVAKQIATLVRALPSEECDGLGIGAAGIVDNSKGYYFFGPNTGLHDINLAEIVSEEIGLRVAVDNDANCAAWAEHRYGAGRGTKHFLCVTLGTGIGGGIVAGGHRYRGARGGAAEIGHMLVDPNGPPCGCGRRGCWEQFASGLAMERIAREELADHPESVLHEHEGRVPGTSITLAARGNDPFACDIVERTARWIGWGIGSLVNILEPEKVAIAGGVVRDWDLFAAGAEAAMRERTEAADRRQLPDLVPAEFGPDAGILGAALLVLDDEG